MRNVVPSLSKSQRRLFEAVVVVYERDGRATLRAVGHELMFSSVGGLSRQLKKLRAKGYVDFCGPGTLRPVLQPHDRIVATDRQRPGESVREWCRRLDVQHNAPEGVAS